jgi:transcriptional regulator with XRE-family HTH domain
MATDHFKERFRWACARAGYSLDIKGNQRRLAGLLGVSSQAISQWLSQATYPAAEKMLLIAEKLHISLDWLLVGRGNPVPGDDLTEEEWALVRRWRAYSPQQQTILAGLVQEIPPRYDNHDQAA